VNGLEFFQVPLEMDTYTTVHMRWQMINQEMQVFEEWRPIVHVPCFCLLLNKRVLPLTFQICTHHPTQAIISTYFDSEVNAQNMPYNHSTYQLNSELARWMAYRDAEAKAAIWVSVMYGEVQKAC
jgi:hypothetical protein